MSILDKAARIFAAFKCGQIVGMGGNPRDFSRMDSGILQVAMMVSALDGNVLDEELRMFDELAKECRGYSAVSAGNALATGLRAAGYIALQAKRLTVGEISDVFVAEVEGVLPDDFSEWRVEDIRRAFALWVVMAMADGEYSGIERKAIGDLFHRFKSAIREANEANEDRVRALSPTHVGAFANRNASMASRSLDENLLERIEAAVREGGPSLETIENIITKG